MKHVRPQSGLADNLDSVHAQRVPLVHNLPRAVRLRIPRIIVASPEGVHVHPRRNDLVGRDLFLLCHHPLGIVAPNIEGSNRGHPMSEQQLVDIIRRHVLALIDVDVYVNQAGHHIHALAFNHAIRPPRLLLLRTGTLLFPPLASNRVHAYHALDPVAFDVDVHRSKRRRSRSII